MSEFLFGVLLLIISETIRNLVIIQSEVSQKMSPIPAINRQRSVKIN